jgi:[NiFe] hydrogenase assembly HybE family chaperone
MPEAQDTAEAISSRLEAAFRKIHAERMDGVPILNARLQVEAIGTREWNGHWLSAVITPWFINLMLLPTTQEQGEAWGKLVLGSSVPHGFPAGRFDFLVGEEDGFGRYQMCSLFSPVLEFENHEAAQATAQAALEAIFDKDLDGNAEKDKEVASAEAAPANTLPGAADQPAAPAAPAPSRRGLLTGKIGQDRGQV